MIFGYRGKLLDVQRASRPPKKTIYVIRLKEAIANDTIYELMIPFSGSIWETTDGLFKNQAFDISSNEKKYDICASNISVPILTLKNTIFLGNIWQLI